MKKPSTASKLSKLARKVGATRRKAPRSESLPAAHQPLLQLVPVQLARKVAPAAPPLEAAVEQAARLVAERKGCLLVKLHHGVVGLPDRLLLRPGGTCRLHRV